MSLWSQNIYLLFKIYSFGLWIFSNKLFIFNSHKVIQKDLNFVSNFQKFASIYFKSLWFKFEFLEPNPKFLFWKRFELYFEFKMRFNYENILWFEFKFLWIKLHLQHPKFINRFPIPFSISAQNTLAAQSISISFLIFLSCRPMYSGAQSSFDHKRVQPSCLLAQLVETAQPRPTHPSSSSSQHNHRLFASRVIKSCVTPGFNIKTRSSSYVSPRSSYHTYGKNVTTENQCLYYINFITRILSLQKRLLTLLSSSSKNSNPTGNRPGATHASRKILP
jgi:hypothetical protein